jgi:AcrR family transcriptional regulator
VPKTKPVRPAARRQTRSRSQLSELILGAADRLFASRGFSEPTIRDIAQAAEVPLPTLYRLFVDKRAIYMQCCQRAARKQIALATSFYESTDAADVVVYKLLRGRLQVSVDQDTGQRLLQRVILDGDDDMLGDVLADFRASALHKAGVSAMYELSGGHLPMLRMLMTTAFAYVMPDFLKFLPASEIDIHDLDDLVQKVLSIVFPGVDWAQVAKKCGSETRARVTVEQESKPQRSRRS